MDEHLYIIGNGFDLSLGYNTSYSNYLDSDIFRKLTANNSDNNFAKHLESLHCSNKSEKRWIDLEVEIPEYIKKTPNLKADIFKDEYKELKKTLKEYLLESVKPHHNTESPARYLVEKIWKDHNQSNKINIVDFNYTGKCNKLVNEYNRNKEEYNFSYFQPHGCLSKGFVLSAHDQALGKDFKYFYFVKKGHQEHYENVHWHELYVKAKHIVFFGHSLGESDKDVIAPLFTHLLNTPIGQNKTIQIYFKPGDEDKYNIKLDELLGGNITTLKSKHRLELNPNDL